MRLSLCVLLSLLWHGLQWLLFNTVFEVQNPSLDGEGNRALSVALEPLVGSFVPGPYGLEKISDIEKTEELDGIEDPSRPFVSDSPVPVRNFAQRRLPRESQRHGFSSGVAHFDSTPSDLAEPSVIDLTSSTRAIHPYVFQGEVKKRRVVQAPPLPDYPDWALLAAVELSLKVSLEVDPNGRVEGGYIVEGSGDSATDLMVLEYVEKIRFEPSLSRSRGFLEWEFRLER